MRNRQRANPDLLIDTREDKKLKGVTIPSGSFDYTEEFDLRRDGNAGALALYIDCSGPGTFDLIYETDPGEEGAEEDPRAEDWFEGDCGNPLRESFATGRSSTPMAVPVGQYIRFKIVASGGDVTINYIKLVIQ